MKILVVVFLLLLMLLAKTEAGATNSPKSKPLVGFENGRLSIRAADVALEDLLREIEAKSGIVIDIKHRKATPSRYSADFKNFSPVLAFRTILKDFNFAFFYSGTHLTRVLILPTGDQNTKAKSGIANPGRSAEGLLRAESAFPKSEATPKLLQKDTQSSDIRAKLDAIAVIEDSHDPKSIAFLGEALADRHPKVKEAALRALAAKQGRDVTEMLRRGLNDSDPEFRIEIIEALADRGDLGSVRKALADRNQQVRETAADLLWNATAQK